MYTYYFQTRGQDIVIIQNKSIKEIEHNLKQLDSLNLLELTTTLRNLINQKFVIRCDDIDNDFTNYEELLRKLEKDIREHIKVQFQLKIYAESLEYKLEQLEKSRSKYELEKQIEIDLLEARLKETIEKNKGLESVKLIFTIIENTRIREIY